MEVFGHSYTLRGDAPAEYLAALAARVDRLMRAIAASSPRLGPVEVGVLAALRLCHQVEQLEREVTGLRRRQEELERLLAAEWDGRLEGEGSIR